MKTISYLCIWFCLATAVAQPGTQPSFRSFDGTRIHYQTQGRGRAVVLLHGFIVHGKMWEKSALVPALVQAGCQVITLDLRGNGLSDKPHSPKSYENNAEVRDVMALVKHLKIKRYDVVGYSRGAILAARLLTMDKHVRSAVLGGMGADFTNPDWPRRQMFQEAFQGKAHLHPETNGAIAYAKSSGADTVALGLLQQFQPVTTVAELSKIKTPVLVISGDQDTENGKAGDLAKLLLNATLKSVPGNHNNTAQSEGFAKEVVKFLAEH